ncbi:MAG: heme lyase CcmF/NrfE family subunit [Candidatus Rokubacteria bacterium]|nr:heme lyase CcmF/NrfE family subunit [Candidatus Rokubacteria bacterium]
MTATLGTWSLLLALAFAVAGLVAPALRRRGDVTLPIRLGGIAIAGQFVLVTVAALLLVRALVTSDFSLHYVAQNSSLRTPFYFKITGLWAALEGSLLLWEWMVVLFAGLVLWLYRERHRALMPWVLAVFSGVSAFFLGVLAFASPPFARQFPVPLDGRGLNPLLEDADMLTHPPLLYAGFVGLTVPYAFAIAALVTARLDDGWISTIRRWTLAAWLFLTLGNLFGGWWSYHILGWGGYWAWDPVENASFLPWLPATALLHSIQIQERRGMLKVWNLSLIIVAFVLTLFGTFLTRSGVLSSVHAFSSGPVGTLFLAFLAIVLLGSFSLVALRADRLRSQPEIDSAVSRESTFVLANVVLAAATFTVFLGTIFPLVAEAVTGVKLSVGAPYFSRVTVPLFVALLLLMGVGPLIAWRKASLDNLRRNFLVPVALSAGVALALAVAGAREPWAIAALALSAFVVLTIAVDVARATRARRAIAGEGVVRAVATLFRRNPRRYGGFVVHLGVVLVVVGITGSMNWSEERSVTVSRGEQLKLGRYTVRFEGLDSTRQPTHERVEARFRIFNDRHDVGVLTPALKFFPTQQSPLGRAVLRMGWTEDLYVILSSFSDLQAAQATVKVMVRPLVSSIWLGGVVMVLGTALALWPRAPRPREA